MGKTLEERFRKYSTEDLYKQNETLIEQNDKIIRLLEIIEYGIRTKK